MLIFGKNLKIVNWSEKVKKNALEIKIILIISYLK